MNLTPWFPAYEKPKRYGWYDACVRIYLDDVSFFVVEKRLLYRDRVWWTRHPKMKGVCIRTIPPIRWRGLTAEGKQ